MIIGIDEKLFPGFSHFKKIGEGAFGKVFTAINAKTNVQIAIKTIDKINLMTESNRNVLQSELSIYNSVEHPFLTQFYATTEDNAGVYVALECGEKGSLLDRIASVKKLKEPQACKIFCEILSALKYLHNTANIVHRDIKAENIVVDSNDDIRLIDFGLSSFLKSNNELNEICGTFPYSSPEMLRGIPYTKSVDIWSCGILLYLMVTGVFPFNGTNQKELKQNICFKEPQIPTNLSLDLRDLILKLLSKDPSERITIEEISTHPWILSNRCSYYLTQQFDDNLKYCITPHQKSDINIPIFNTLTKNGYDVATLEDDLLSGKLTECTILYKYFLKRQFLIRMHSPEEIRIGKNLMHNVRKVMTCQVEKPLPCMHNSAIPSIKSGIHRSVRSRSQSVTLKLNVNHDNSSNMSGLPALTPSPKIKKIGFQL